MLEEVFRLLNRPTKGCQAADEEIVYLQVGETVWDKVPRHMRSELWMSELHKESTGTRAAARYSELLFKDIPKDTLDGISKDVARTYPCIERFACRDGQQAILRVLRAYAAYDPDIGYCQGMNFIAGLLLLYLETESFAFGGLVVLMEERGLRELYNHDMSRLQAELWQLSQLMPKGLSEHLEKHGVLPVLFASSWLLTCFAVDFPISFAARVMDVLLTDSCEKVMLKVALAILKKCQRQLKRRHDMEEILVYLKSEVPGWKQSKVQGIISGALSSPWTSEQKEILHKCTGMETVQEMVSRVMLQNSGQTASENVGKDGEEEQEPGADSTGSPKSGQVKPAAGATQILDLPKASADSASSIGPWCMPTSSKDADAASDISPCSSSEEEEDENEGGSKKMDRFRSYSLGTDVVGINVTKYSPNAVGNFVTRQDSPRILTKSSPWWKASDSLIRACDSDDIVLDWEAWANSKRKQQQAYWYQELSHASHKRLAIAAETKLENQANSSAERRLYERFNEALLKPPVDLQELGTSCSKDDQYIRNGCSNSIPAMIPVSQSLCRRCVGEQMSTDREKQDRRVFQTFRNAILNDKVPQWPPGRLDTPRFKSAGLFRGTPRGLSSTKTASWCPEAEIVNSIDFEWGPGAGANKMSKHVRNNTAPMNGRQSTRKIPGLKEAATLAWNKLKGRRSQNVISEGDEVDHSNGQTTPGRRLSAVE